MKTRRLSRLVDRQGNTCRGLVARMDVATYNGPEYQQLSARLYHAAVRLRNLFRTMDRTPRG